MGVETDSLDWKEIIAMSLVSLAVMYGHLEGAGGNFARDPTAIYPSKRVFLKSMA
jgi:hypothetical protein